MSEQSATPESGALTVEQAIESLVPSTPPEEQEDAPAAEAEAVEPEGETSSPEEAEAEPEEQAEAEETEAEDAEPVVALEPPKYWSQDAKAEFAALPPSLQAVVLAQEGPREEAAARAKAEAAEKVKAAETELGKVGQLAEALADRLPKWIQAFEAQWGTKTPDWVAYAQEHGVEMMTLAKTQFEAEREQLAEAAQAQRIAETQAHGAFVQAEFAKLSDVEPELADPEKGAERRRAAAEHAIQRGIPPEAVKLISAAELSIAYDAMRWRQAQAAIKAAPKPKPAVPAQRAPVRPAAAASAPHPTKQAVGRFHAKPDVDNAVALLLAQKGN